MVSPPPPAPEDVPVTSSRAVRLAVTRAADKAHGLAIGVGGLREETAALDDMLAMPGQGDMLVALMRQGIMVGLAVLDKELRSALGEVQTVGHVLPTPPEDRPPTATDCALVVPFLQAVLLHLADTAGRTPLAGWSDHVQIGRQVASPRAAGLILPEENYRIMRLALDLQAGDRQGALILALPDHLVSRPAPLPATTTGDWETRFRAAVNAAPVRLRAEVARFKVPLSVAETFAPGQIVPLPGCLVTSVTLRARDGRKVATARLGQSGGLRAVRLERPAQPALSETVPDALAGAMGLVAADMGELDDGVDAMADFDSGQDGPDWDADDVVQRAGAAVSMDANAGGTGEDELSWDLEGGGDAQPLDWSLEEDG